MDYTEAKLKEETGKELIIYALMDKWTVDTPAISDEEAKAFYDGHPEQFKHGERVKASHILIQTKESASAHSPGRAPTRSASFGPAPATRTLRTPI